MGFSNSKSERTTFANIVNGKFAIKANQDNPNAVARVNKKNETVYEILHDKLEAKIVSMKIEKDDYGKKLVIELEEAADRYTLTLPVESKFFDHFCAKIGNVDRSQLVTIAPYSFIPKGEAQKKSGLNFYQSGLPDAHYQRKPNGEKDGNKVAYYFTEKDAKGKPMPAAKLDEDEWKIFKMQERKFYCEYIAKLGEAKEVERETSRQSQVVDDSLPF